MQISLAEEARGRGACPSDPWTSGVRMREDPAIPCPLSTCTCMKYADLGVTLLVLSHMASYAGTGDSGPVSQIKIQWRLWQCLHVSNQGVCQQMGPVPGLPGTPGGRAEGQGTGVDTPTLPRADAEGAAGGGPSWDKQRRHPAPCLGARRHGKPLPAAQSRPDGLLVEREQ